MQIALFGAVGVVTASHARRATCSSLSWAGCHEPVGVELAAMQRIPLRVRMGNHCKPLTGLPDEPVTTDNDVRDMLHSCR